MAKVLIRGPITDTSLSKAIEFQGLSGRICSSLEKGTMGRNEREYREVLEIIPIPKDSCKPRMKKFLK